MQQKLQVFFPIIDNHTKHAWAIPLKDKSGKSTTTAFKKLMEINSTNSDLKAVFVERVNKTLLDLIKEPMYIKGKGNWLNHLDAAMAKYNNGVHGTTKMTPFEMVSNNNTPILKNINHNDKLPKFRAASPTFPKFYVGDFVRVPDKRTLYSKGYTTNWNRELFKIHTINSTIPVTYTLEDENKEIIQGKYFEQELLRSIFNFDSNNKTLESMNIFHKLEWCSNYFFIINEFYIDRRSFAFNVFFEK